MKALDACVCIAATCAVLYFGKCGHDFYDFMTHVNEPTLKATDQTEMVFSNMEFIPASAQNVQLVYRNIDTFVDVFEFRTEQPFPKLLDRIKAKWDIVRKGDNFVSLQWASEIESWRGEWNAAIWYKKGIVVVARSTQSDFETSEWFMRWVQPHVPFLLKGQSSTRKVTTLSRDSKTPEPTNHQISTPGGS